MLAHLEIQLVTAHPEYLRIHEYGEVAVVMSDSRHVIPESDAFHITERLTVADGDLVAFLNGIIHLTEIEQAVCGTYLIHFGVDTGSYDCGLVGESEVLQIIYPFFSLLIFHHHGSTLNRVVHLRGMETQR